MAPVNIESTLQEQAADRQCCEIGDGRDHLTALIVLEPALAARPDAAHEVARHVAAVNERLSAAAQLVAFTIVAGEWTVAGEELTPTLKIRRATIEKNTPRRSEPCTRDHPATAPHTATHDCGRLDLRPSRARSGRSPGARGRSGRVFVTLALVREAVVDSKHPAGASARSHVRVLVAQSRSPAVADIIGARLAWTVAMISSVSMPCR